MGQNLLLLGLKDPFGVFFQYYNMNGCDGYCILLRRVIQFFLLYLFYFFLGVGLEFSIWHKSI